MAGCGVAPPPGLTYRELCGLWWWREHIAQQQNRKLADAVTLAVVSFMADR